jgi:hypothetical protein
LEAVYRALKDLSRGAVDAVRQRLDGEKAIFEPLQEPVHQI